MRNIKHATCLSDVTGEDVIDSRDLVERLDDLESREVDTADREPDNEQTVEGDLDDDEKELLAALRELRDECEGSGWRDGIGFVRESYWEDYCEEYADDVGLIDNKSDNPLWNCTDWEKWAGMMAQDYQTTDIGGITYYWREA